MRAGEYNPITGEFDDEGWAKCYGDGVPMPCQPIGCDAGIHIPGCEVLAAMEDDDDGRD